MAKENKGGRPTLFKQEYVELAYNYCLLGATDEDLAKFFNVCEDTINNWKKAHPEFIESISRGKEIADIEVVQSLHKLAKGFEYEEHVTGTNEKGKTIDLTYKKYSIPDFRAGRFWLMNRQSKRWRDKQEEQPQNVQKLEVSFTEDKDTSNEDSK